MRSFIKRALKMFNRLDKEQIRTLVHDIASENELLEVVMNSMSDGVMVSDTAHKLILSNKAIDRILPFNTRDPYEKIIWSVIKDSDIKGFIRETLENQEKAADREYTISAGGHTKTLAFSILPLVREGKIQGSLIHVEDITEKRGEEARLRRAENLASLTTLAAGVAHEIKNPLGSIGIHIQLIQKAMKQKRKMEVGTINRYLDIVNEEVERLNGIVIDFLFAVRPMDAILKETDINKVITDLFDFVHFEIDEAGITLITELDKDIPLIQLDDRFMKQAFLNIVKNAIAAMPEGGVFTVKSEVAGEFVQISLNDTGIGIPKKDIAKIFEPYYTTRDFGSGLGLTVVYKIIKEHGGDIILESEEGKGTTFIISIPIPQHKLKLLGWKGKRHEV